MRIEPLLVHRCDITSTGSSEPIGRDPYGRPIYGEPGSSQLQDVPCRLDQIRERNVADDTGRDIVLNTMIIFGPDVSPDYSMQISNIRDQDGRSLLEGSFTVESIHPAYKMRDLHHYEITLSREGG